MSKVFTTTDEKAKERVDKLINNALKQADSFGIDDKYYYVVGKLKTELQSVYHEIEMRKTLRSMKRRASTWKV